MPRYEAKVYKFMCDICRTWSEPVVDTSVPPLPEGWGPRTLHGCGMTGYTRHETLCPTCVVEDGDAAPALGDTDGPK
jgi:hypothetical protein